MTRKQLINEFLLFAQRHLERTEQDVADLKTLMEKLNAGLDEAEAVRQHAPD